MKVAAYIIAIIVFLVFMIESFTGKPKLKSSSNEPVQSDKWKEGAWIVKGKDLVKSRLKDPSSAEFRNVFFVNNGLPTSCGEVNSKNSFGGYSGFQRYLYAGDTIVLLEEDDKELFEKTWNEICIKSK